MSLEQSKQYDTQLKPRDFRDKSAERINKGTPHQAPQRERVSISTHTRRPSSAAARAGSRRSPGKQRGWRDHIEPSVNMGVPTLMIILEPNVVWGHSHTRSRSNSRGVEAAACQGYFFDGLDQQSQLSHGVYEGSYWQLLGDLSELEDMLSRMTRAPALLQEPVLELPQQPELPKWDQFKPELLTLPDAPSAAADPVLPEFVEPDLPQSAKLSPPQLEPVPPVPAPWKEVAAPEFIPPPALNAEPLRVPELVLPPAPVHKEPAKPAGSGPPQCGHDWSGKRPFTVHVPTYSPPSLPPEPVEIPEQLPEPELQEAQLQLQPEPLVALSWAGGPEDPDDDSSIAVLSSAAGAAAAVDATSSATTAAGVSSAGSSGSGVAGSAKASSAGVNAVWNEAQAVQQLVKALATEELHDAWKEVQSIAPAVSGAPAIWLDFKAPFAEPPPVLLPPEPEAGPEPQYEPPGELLDLPAYKLPVPQPMPEYVEPPVVLPTWASPCEPLPVGFLRGTAPVLIMDVSGTMHPARRGQFLRVKKCVCELLEPEGELATAGSAFDVLAFSGSCWSWSAAYAGKQALIASAMQSSNTGRQVGGRQSGQLAQHTSSLARTRTQWQRQQVQQRWQQQQQQHRPGTAAAGSRNAETLEGTGAAEGAEHGEAVGDQWQQQQQGLEVATTPRAVAGTRPGTASAAAAAGHTRPMTTEAAGSSSPRSMRPMTADSAVRHSTEPQITSPRQQQQRFGPMLQPADADHLQEARSWVQNWPEAVGNTKLLTALNTAHQYTFTPSSSPSPRFRSVAAAAAAGVVGPYGECSSDSVDCYYLFSDGLADDAVACLQWVQQQEEAGMPLRPVHTVGFFPRNGSPAGERFLSQLATATGGTFQVYNADLPVPAAAAAILRKIIDSSKPPASTEAAADAAEPTAAAAPAAAGVPKVWDSTFGAFVAVDLQNEDAATRTERRWAEQQLKQRRMDNRRLGRIEPLHTMLEALRQQHQQERVMAAMDLHQQKLLQLKAAHTAACAAVTKANEAAVRQAQREHAVTVQQVQAENKRRVSAAHQAHAAAVQEWKQQYHKAMSAWQQAVNEAQALAAAAAAAAEAQARGVIVPEAAPDTADATAHGSNDDAEALQAGQCGSDSMPASESKNSRIPGLAAAAAAAADSFVIQQPQQQPSSEGSIGSVLGPDLSLAQQEDAASEVAIKPAAVGAVNSNAEHSAEALQQQVVGTSSAGDDVIEGNSSSSAKLTLPLPAARDTQSIQNTARSFSSWSGTPRLPDAAAAAAGVGSSQQLQRPGTAASRPQSAAVAQSNSAGRGLGTKVCIAASTAALGSGASILASSSNAPAAAAAASSSKPKANSRPKSAVARLSADSGGSTAVNANKQKQKGSNSSKSSSSGSKRPSSGVSLSEPGRLSAATAAAAAAVLGNAADGDCGDHTAKSGSSGDLVGAADYSSNEPGARRMSYRRSYTSVHQRDRDIQQQQQSALTQEERLLNHIQTIHVINRATLEQIYSEWHNQVVEAELYNSSALQLHNHESQIHAARHAAYLTQYEAWEAGVQELQQRAQQEHEVAAARATAENARVAKLHQQEVNEKAAREAAYAQFISEHAAAHTAAVKQHEAAVAAAKATHAAAVSAAQEVWQQQQAELEQQYQQQLAAAMQQHTEKVQQVKEQNRLSREAHKDASEAYRTATLGNKRMLALYEEQQREAAEQLAAANAAALQQARQDYKVLCAQLLELHTQQQATAQAEWLASKAAVQQRNEEAIAAARARYAAAVDELLQEHQAVCDQLKQQHEAELTRTRSRNEELMPQALVAQVATTELGRVRTFATHIRTCAAKLQLGLNFLTERPNLDRVVEMSALTDGLRAAFPDVVEPRDYPWPLEELRILPQPELQPEQQYQQQLESLPAHQLQVGRNSSNDTSLAAPASAVPAKPGSPAALGWGRTVPRPGTAPAAGARAHAHSTSSTGSLQSALQSSSRVGWHVRAPGVIDYKAALQDPALMLKQLQRPRSSNTCQHKSHGRASSPRSITGTRHKQRLPGHIGSSPVQSAPVGLQYVTSLQRPQTAPAVGQTVHAQTAMGSSLHNSSHAHQHVDKWTLQEENRSGLGTAWLHGMLPSTASLGSMGAGGRGAIGVPARRAVEHSRAGQRMAQELVMHGKRQSYLE